MKQHITDKVYSSDSLVERFKAAHPDQPILHTSPTKVIQVATDQEALQYGPAWQQALKGILIVTADELICVLTTQLMLSHGSASGINDTDDFIIPVASIAEAVIIMLKPQGLILKIVANHGKHYYFGLTPGPWSSVLPFPSTQISARLGYSRASIVRRAVIGIIILAAIGLWLTALF